MKKLVALFMSAFILLNTALLLACSNEEVKQIDTSSEQNQSETASPLDRHI